MPLQFSIIMEVKGGMEATPGNPTASSTATLARRNIESIVIRRPHVELSVMAVAPEGGALPHVGDTLCLRRGEPPLHNDALAQRLAGIGRAVGTKLATTVRFERYLALRIEVT